MLPKFNAMKYLLILAVAGFISCNDSTEVADRKDGFTPQLKTKEDSLYHDVMKGHDVGMAKMGEIKRRQDYVQHELDSLNKLPASKINDSRKKAMLDLKEDLAYADHAMFEWMKEFDTDSAKSDSQKRIAYLEAEKVKVQKVRDNILNGLARADSLFNK